MFTDAAKNTMLDALTSLHLALFDGDPAGSGTEVSAARVAGTFDAASEGERALTNSPVLTVTGGDQATHWAVFTASTGGTLLGSDALSSTKTDAADFTVTIQAGSTIDLNNDPA